jgi:ribonuclease Z
MLLPGDLVSGRCMTQLRLIFLGTGGSWPTIKRNVSALAVKRGSEIILFDCGEGTQRQFQHSNLSYMQISKIFITHYHGDHFLGLPGLIQTMQLNDRERPLHLYGPKGMAELTNQLLTLGYFRPSYKVIPHDIISGQELSFEGYSISALKVNHNVPALSYCLQEHPRPGKFNKSKALKLRIPEGPLFSKLQKGNTISLPDGTKITPDMILGPSRNGRKIVISGDTKPSEEMIRFSEGADILVHEATFDSRLQDIAWDYGHTTASQAADIATKAHVEKLFLVHISPRYLDFHVLEDEARSVFAHSYVPKDFQEVEVKLKK